ncbi:alpha/beta fold hydrolase [Parasphingorhabdus halotolerans]|uniref:Alpha/beta fold hydrolase n=1 Tax=Parasphingorhabdus halotolerans TaxID=2725558 RepID=A0A6H2DI38_9SPHN|nr:alpha/beta fold hydrolase [Parasphingorhabdus halotolerans]QJB68050.1 alpha/beta fold hydrolase [Parasphingorhabdus halotolerans]
MLNIVLWIIAGLIAGSLILYFVFPRLLYSAMRNGLRRKGGLVEKSVKTGEFDWPYLEGGPSDGEVVLLVHGFGGDKDNWALFSPQITEKYRLISMDLPGFGENDRSLNREYDIASQVERLREFLDALRISKCHIGGNSMGGHIALQFALTHPEYLKSLTLYNNAGVEGKNESELVKSVENGENALAINSVEDVKRMMAFVTHNPPPIPGQFRKVFFEEANAHKELLDKIFWTIVKDTQDRPLNGELGGLKVPTLIIWGRHDQLIDVSCAEAIHAGVENSELVIFEDVGHIPMIEKPKEVAAAQLAFLAKH